MVYAWLLRFFKLQKKVIHTALHVLVWMLFIAFCFFIDADFRFDVLFNVLVIGLCSVVFYFTYYLLIPILHRKNSIVFIVLSVLLLGSISVLKYNMITSHIDEIQTERVESSSDLRMPSTKIYSTERVRLAYKGKQWGASIFTDFTNLFLFYFMAIAICFIKKWKKNAALVLSMEKQKVHTELQYLKQQINPHFLFNSLNNIYSLSLSHSVYTSNSILKLSAILRYMLYESEDTQVSLSKEVSILKDYIDLQKLRLTDLVALNVNVEGSLKGYKIAPFLLMPIVENAFKYGVDNVNKSFINIRFVIEDGILFMSVSNKIVIVETNKKESGIGLSNIKRRLELLYPYGYSLSNKSEDGNYEVSLKLKLHV